MSHQRMIRLIGLGWDENTLLDRADSIESDGDGSMPKEGPAWVESGRIVSSAAACVIEFVVSLILTL